MGHYEFKPPQAHNRKSEDKTGKRKSGNRGDIQKCFFIVCEGKETEPNYFNSWRLKRKKVKVEAVGTGKSALSLVKDAIDKISKKKFDGEVFEQVWCVFDIDDNKRGSVNAAIEMARSKDINIAYSNEDFELWYLLHFDYISSAIHRKQYEKMLSKYLGEKYDKCDPDMYNKLKKFQDKAIKNAENLLKLYPSFDPEYNNPSTTVHLLVKELNTYLPKKGK